jgi:hypothetical protein
VIEKGLSQYHLGRTDIRSATGIKGGKVLSWKRCIGSRSDQFPFAISSIHRLPSRKTSAPAIVILPVVMGVSEVGVIR